MNAYACTVHVIIMDIHEQFKCLPGLCNHAGPAKPMKIDLQYVVTI